METKMNHKIITCTGYGNTGSSAGTNFLEEFDCIKSIGSSNFEFTFLHECDGILDLQNALKEGHRLKVDLAIKRFINLSKKNISANSQHFNHSFEKHFNDYLKSLNLLSWNGGWHRASELSTKNYRKKVKQNMSKQYFRHIQNKFSYSLYEGDSWRPGYVPYTNQYYLEYNEEDFINKTSRFISNLCNECDSENKFTHLHFDQMIPPISPELYTKFVDDIKVIVIDRDPRDLYFANKVFWGNRFFPSDDVYTFINWYKATRKTKTNSTNVLYLFFEDLVFHYDEISKRLYDFIQIDEKHHINKKTIFIPEKSKKNTRLWLKYSFDDKDYESKILNEIHIIESELKDFCFNYESIPLSQNKENVSFIFEKTLHQADSLQSKKIKIREKLRYVYLNFCFLLKNEKLHKTIHWIKISKNKNTSFWLKAIVKIFTYTIFYPFYILFCFVKSIIDCMIV